MNDMEDKQLPQDKEAEKTVLATIMADKNALPEVRQMLDVEAFYYETHREIYKAQLAISERGDFPDLITVMNELNRRKSGVTPYELTEISGHVTNFLAQHAAEVFDKYKRRQFFEIGCYLQSNCFSEDNDVVDVAEEARKKMEGIFPDDGRSVSTIRDAVQGVYDNINRNMTGGEGLTGSPTGFGELDRRSGGLQTSDLVIIAADTSMGKTSLAIKMAMNAGCPVAFYSMEMKKEQIAARMISIETGVSANEILYSRLGASQISAIDKGVSQICEKPVFFDDRSTSSIETILASIRMMKIKYGIKGAVVDYLQILNVNMKGANKEQQMGDVARRLKNIAKDLDIWVIALSQINRDRDNPAPSLSRLRDSGQIAEAADTVILIYRPEVYGRSYPDPFTNASTKDTAMIEVAKGRNIGLLKFIVGFNKPTTNFYELGTVPQAEFQQKEEDPF